MSRFYGYFVPRRVVFLSHSFRLGIFLPFSEMKQKMGVYFDELPVIPRGFQNDKISHSIFVGCPFLDEL